VPHPQKVILCPYLGGQRPEGLAQTMSRGTRQTTTREQTFDLYYKITVKYYYFNNHILYETILSPILYYNIDYMCATIRNKLNKFFHLLITGWGVYSICKIFYFDSHILIHGNGHKI
jgi:hypothetical protein